MRTTLLRGSLIAVIGVLILLYFGTFVPPTELKPWGFPIVFLGIALIALGLIPYRRLRKRETTPDEIIIGTEGYLQYFTGGKQRYSIPMSMIEKAEFFENDKSYGIALTLKKDSDEKVILHDIRYNMRKDQTTSRKQYGCDLFIPYFSRRAYMRLNMAI